MIDWIDGKASDDTILDKTDALKGTKKGKNLLIFSGSYVLQHFDYRSVMQNKSFDTLLMNFGYLIPESEKSTFIFHGSLGYVKAFQNCSTFRYFCESFQGTHVFMMNTKHCAGGAYPLAAKKEVITTIKVNKIKNFNIVTHAYGNKFKSHGFGYVPSDVSSFSPSKLPYGCGGSLNAMALPFAIQLGYSKIYILGVSDQLRIHFYDPSFIHPQFRKKTNPTYQKLTLERYSKLNSLAKSNGTQLFVLPKKYIEPSVQKAIPCVDNIF